MGSRRKHSTTLERVAPDTKISYRYTRKLAIPRLKSIFPRERLFRLIDASLDHPAIWITGVPGAGKTTLIAGYLKDRGKPSIWYQVDEGNNDIAGFSIISV